MMIPWKTFVASLVLPFLVSCLSPVSEYERSIAYMIARKTVHRKHQKINEVSSEQLFTNKKKYNPSTSEEEAEQETWLTLPMNGLGVPNYGVNDLQIAEIGQVFTETSRHIVELLKNKMISTTNILPAIRPPFELQQECPFSAPLDCDETYPYRNADGSCNNLLNPYFGKSSTPFERYLPALYNDDIDAPRGSVISGSDLPSARVISTNFHSSSNSDDCQYELVHLSALFGIFLGHDLFDFQSFPILEGATEEETDCCICGVSSSCYPITIQEDDEYFGSFNRTCLPFRRSLPSPEITCVLGLRRSGFQQLPAFTVNCLNDCVDSSREQLNRATSFMDASQIYGSDLETQLKLRTMTGGLMRTTSTDCNDLLPQTETYCSSTNGNLCFLGGDSRVNIHPLITVQHTLFVREHNRLANLLGATYPDWCDETLFQEARRFLIAEIQHITNNEYLPLIIGSDLMEAYNLIPLHDGYFGYLATIYPATRNSFASAAFLFGYSGVLSKVSVNGTSVPFASLFYNLDVFYNFTDALTVLYEGLTVDLQQDIDRLMTEELTNKLSETEPGNGWDLAAVNIHSGRDNGLPTYNMWRRWCGLQVADNFSCLTDHDAEDQTILEEIYECVEDVDLWVGGISEIHVTGGSVGPTFACIIARQFQALKFGDRFWYESSGSHQLPLGALRAIRNASMSRLLCDNTDIEQIQMNAFKAASEANPIVPCTEIPAVDECDLVRRYSDWCAWSECVDNQRYRSRRCTAPVSGFCSCEDVQRDVQVELCENTDA